MKHKFRYSIGKHVDGDLQDVIWGRPALRTASGQSIEHLEGTLLMGVALGQIQLQIALAAANDLPRHHRTQLFHVFDWI
jgi:hypothetical protein